MSLGKSKENIEDISNKVVNNYNPNPKIDIGYVDIINIAEKLGFEVMSMKLPEEEDGFIIINESSSVLSYRHINKLIGVNYNRSLAWKRFIIAHELGHYYLEYANNPNDLFGMYASRESNKGRSKDENKADFFAACLLMPRVFFEKAFNDIKRTFKDGKVDMAYMIFTLSQKFIVTERMAQRRIEELGLK